MTRLAFVALLDRQGERFSGSLLDFPSVSAEASSREEVIQLLREKLGREVLRVVDETDAFPEPKGPPPRRDYALLTLPNTEFSEKASEKLLDFTKAEFDRVLASMRLAEDRAKQNGVYALAALPLLSFMRPEDPPLWYIIGQIVALIVVVLILVSVARTLRSITFTGIGWTSRELNDELEIVYQGYRPYPELLYQLQSTWVKNTDAIRLARDERFNLVDQQQHLLIGLVIVLMLLLLLPAAVKFLLI